MELRAEEPRRAAIAMEMVLGKNYLVPKIFGFDYYNKPPLFNWLLAWMFNASGSFSEVWVRLPSILSLFATSYFVYRLVKQYYSKQTAFIAALLLLVSADILYYGAVDAGELDLFFSLLIFLQAAAVFYYSLRQNWWQVFLISYILMAAGVLTKGLPSILIQALLLLCWLIYIKQWKKLFSIQHLTGIVVSAGLIAWYFIAYSKQEDVMVYILQLLTESAQRSALTNKWGSIALNILQSPLQLFYICLPATALLLYACNKKARAALKGERLFAFSLMFTIIICAIFFMSPETANRYLYPAFPFIAIMGAIVYSKAVAVLAPSRWLAGYKTLLIVFGAFAVLRIGYNIWGIPYQLKMIPSYRQLTAKILRYSNNSPVYITGYPQPYPVNSFLFMASGKDSVLGAPLLPYQIPYYVTKATGIIMQYDSIPRKGLFYLTPTNFLKDKKAAVYFTFFDDWTNREIALVKF